MATIEEIYAYLTKKGVEHNFYVVAEFCASPNNSLFEKNIDLVWLSKRDCADTERIGSLREWKIEAAFEIEGYDVPIDRIRIHSEQFNVLRNEERVKFPCYVPLYTEALHRSDPEWGTDKPQGKITSKIAQRQDKAKEIGCVIKVCDCRTWDWVDSVLEK